MSGAEAVEQIDFESNFESSQEDETAASTSNFLAEHASLQTSLPASSSGHPSIVTPAATTLNHDTPSDPVNIHSPDTSSRYHSPFLNTGDSVLALDRAETEYETESIFPYLMAARLDNTLGSDDESAASNAVTSFIDNGPGQSSLAVGQATNLNETEAIDVNETEVTNVNETKADQIATQDGNHGETPEMSTPFFRLPIEIRHDIYHRLIPQRKSPRVIAEEARMRAAPAFKNPHLTSRSKKPPVEKQPANRAWLDWINLPSQAMGLFGANKRFHDECCEFTYGKERIMKIRITPTETSFFAAVLPTAKFLPFPISTNWNWLRHWDVDLVFSQFNCERRTAWGYAFKDEDAGMIVHKVYNRLDQKAFYEYKHIEEGFMAMLHALKHVSGLESLTVRLPCVCCCKGNEGHFMRERYMLLLRTHLATSRVQPAESLTILLGKIGQKHVQCPEPDCAYFSSAVSQMIMVECHRSDPTIPCPCSQHALLSAWADVKERATLLSAGGDALLRTALFKTWYVLGWGRQTHQEKAFLVEMLHDAIDAELSTWVEGAMYLRHYLNYLAGEDRYTRSSAPEVPEKLMNWWRPR
ncbi:MAG: hypothetical protein Q9212_006726 [Teloschistes hypoglaucus]